MYMSTTAFSAARIVRKTVQRRSPVLRSVSPRRSSLVVSFYFCPPVGRPHCQSEVGESTHRPHPLTDTNSSQILALRRFLSTSGGQIGFIGLGNMGAAMAVNILKARGKTVVYDVSALRFSRTIRHVPR